MHKISVAKMILLKWIYGKIKKEKIINKHIRKHLGIALVDDKLRKTRLKFVLDMSHAEQQGR